MGTQPLSGNLQVLGHGLDVEAVFELQPAFEVGVLAHALLLGQHRLTQFFEVDREVAERAALAHQFVLHVVYLVALRKAALPRLDAVLAQDVDQPARLTLLILLLLRLKTPLLSLVGELKAADPRPPLVCRGLGLFQVAHQALLYFGQAILPLLKLVSVVGASLQETRLRPVDSVQGSANLARRHARGLLGAATLTHRLQHRDDCGVLFKVASLSLATNCLVVFEPLDLFLTLERFDLRFCVLDCFEEAHSAREASRAWLDRAVTSHEGACCALEALKGLTLRIVVLQTCSCGGVLKSEERVGRPQHALRVDRCEGLTARGKRLQLERGNFAIGGGHGEAVFWGDLQFGNLDLVELGLLEFELLNLLEAAVVPEHLLLEVHFKVVYVVVNILFQFGSHLL